MKTQPDIDKPLTRRPIAARDTRWAAAISKGLIRVGLRPNTISVLSAVCGAIAGGSLLATSHSGSLARIALFIVAAAMIQLRLLCNLFDGMVAVEGGFRTKSGEIYNELPDRISDAVILAGAGYSISNSPWLADLGWAAATAAVITAYVRTLGAAAGTTQHFCGPMAKQQRMFLVTLAALGGALEAGAGWAPRAMAVALVIILVGCIVTIVRRTVLVIRDLESK
jgi:phosphatidylglycerophosphate synthase